MISVKKVTVYNSKKEALSICGILKYTVCLKLTMYTSFNKSFEKKKKKKEMYSVRNSVRRRSRDSDYKGDTSDIDFGYHQEGDPLHFTCLNKTYPHPRRFNSTQPRQVFNTSEIIKQGSFTH